MLRVRRRLVISAVLAPVLLALSPAVAPTASGAPATTSFVTMVGEAGDAIFGDRTTNWRPGAGSVTLGVSEGVADVSVSGGSSGESYDLTLAAPPGQALKPGTYVNAQRTTFRTAGHPGIDIFGDGRGCNTTSGRFTVLDAPADHSRLWLTYEQHCEGAVPALFGEIRINEPTTNPGLLVAPDHVAWPTEYLGLDSKVVPVNLYNTGSQNITVSDASITDGDADFSISGNTCTTIHPGEMCVVYVNFRPATQGHRAGTLTIEDSTHSTPVRSEVVQLDGDTFPGDTEWTLHSQPGDRYGGGDTDISPSSYVMTATGDEHHVLLRAAPRGSGMAWSADFQAGPGEVLLPGTTVTVTKPYDPADGNSASMQVGARGDCDTMTGTFTVQDAAYQDGQLTRLDVDFEQHCNGASAALTGTIKWRAATEDHTTPGVVSNLQATPSLGSATLTWTNPTDSDWAEAVVRQTFGDDKPALTPSQGTNVYHGRHDTATATGLAGGTDYTFTVYSFDAAGHHSDFQSVTLVGNNITATGPRTLLAGSAATLHGRLTDAQGGPLRGGRQVNLERRLKGTDYWVPLATTTTDEHGVWSYVVHPGYTWDYRASYPGGGFRLGVTSAPTRVSVAPRVSLHADHTHGSRQARFTLTTHVSPGVVSVKLQRLTRGHWRDVDTKVRDRNNDARFVARPGHKGSYSFRTVVPAEPTRLRGVSRVVTLHVA